MQRYKPLIVALLIFISAAVPRLLIVAQPIAVQLDKTLPDDAYYYFLTARNVVDGRGPSVDGLNPSNGWHPLWMLVNTAVFASVTGEPDAPVRTSLAIGALCDSLVSLCIYYALHRLKSESAAVIGALAYALNVMPMFQSVNGLETGIAALLLAFSWLLILHLLNRPRNRSAVLWGMVFGLTFLARTDTALVLACLGFYAAWRLRSSPNLILVGGMTAFAVTVPWLLWNYTNFGSLFDQVSSVAVPWTARARIAAEQPDLHWSIEGLRVFLYPPYWIRGDYLGAPPVIGFFLWILGGWGTYRSLRSAENTSRHLGRLILALLAGGALLLLIHTFVRWYPRPWYFVVTAQSLALSLGLFWDQVERVSLRLSALGISLIGMTLTGLMTWGIGLYPWQSAHQYTAALWAREHLPDSSLLASMNSGIIGYYSGLDTVNLDGVVNPAAFAAIQKHRLLPYLQEIGIDYLLDSDNAVQNEYALFMGEGFPEQLRETGVLTDEYPGLGVLRLYEIVDS